MSALPEPRDPHADARRDALSERDRAILDFEREWWRHAGAKEAAVRERFGLSTARYYQVLNALIDTAAAVRHDPLLVGRLRRVRDARTSARAARSLRPGPGRSTGDPDTH